MCHQTHFVTASEEPQCFFLPFPLKPLLTPVDPRPDPLSLSPRPQMNMLMRLKEAATSSSPHSYDSDSNSNSHQDDLLDSSLESTL